MASILFKLRKTMFLSGLRTRFGAKAFVKVRPWCDINYKMRINILQRNYLQTYYVFT